MYNFSVCISDDIAKSFEQKLQVCTQLLIHNIEIDEKFDGKALVELNGDEIETYRNMLIANSKIIACYSCSEPVNNFDYYKVLFRKAHLLNIKSINVKNPYDSSVYKSAEEFVRNFGKIVHSGESFGIYVLVENQSGTNLAEDSQITKIFKLVNNKYLGLVFNPLEFVKLKRHPFFHVFYYSKLKNDICFLRINDGLYVDGRAVFPGEGNAEIKELASILLSRSFNGYFSFTPYLENMDLDAYEKVIGRFKKMLTEI
ncbi:MAG TPA: hypothetical protein GXX14_11875 [Clostridiaceae bacterium]|nr:hypothetical protein [Clostridiaceae bacterium]